MSDVAPTKTQTMAPTFMAEVAVLSIVAAMIVNTGAVISFLGFKKWPIEAGDVVKYLAWIGLGALMIQGVALLVQLSSTVGSKVKTSIGPAGVSVDIDGPTAA